MADDIFLTPEEQDERARQWLKDNAFALIVGIVLGLGLVFGYQYYKTQQRIKAEQASDVYQKVLGALQNSGLAEISTDIEQLKKDFSASPYTAKATLLYAKQLADKDLNSAISEYDWVIANAAESGVKQAALIRKAKALIGLNQLDQAAAIANSELKSGGYTSFYQDILASIAVKKGDNQAARSHYKVALAALENTGDPYRRILELKIKRLPETTQDSAEEATQNTADSISE